MNADRTKSDFWLFHRRSSAADILLFRSLLYEGYGLDARYVKTFPAAQILAGHLVVQQKHITLRFLEFGPVAFIAASRDAILFLAHQPAQFVGF